MYFNVYIVFNTVENQEMYKKNNCNILYWFIFIRISKYNSK
jgi:hypothetical protein